tara:strand:+ start:1290 stop:2276 length:987 start_codon:yes stop_codon:yes gene_type:complete
MALAKVKTISEEKINDVCTNTDVELPNTVLNIISFIAHKVGAPTYNKTPDFRKFKNKQNQKQNPKQITRHNRRGEKKITNEDWEAIRNFKQTELKKNEEGIMMEIDIIRKLLNQITNEKYDEKTIEIKKNIERCKNTFDEEDFNKIGRLIFDIGSRNKYCSNLYAKLYKELSKDYEIFNEISKNNFSSFSQIFREIKIVKAEEDYNLFCDNNKENSKRKSMGLFFVNLMLEGVLNIEKIMELVLRLKNMVEEKIIINDKSDEVQEIVSNIIILVEKGYNMISKHEKWEVILTHIRSISSANKKDYASLSSKSIFSYLDLLEELELDDE